MITADELRVIMPTAKGRAEAFAEPLNDAMRKFYIDNPMREAAFLAQIAHESGGLHYVCELASGSSYDHRADLGNTRAEAIAVATAHNTTPGQFWRGHGLIQITGYDNHVACGSALGLNLVESPELLEMPDNAAASAGWFWQTHGLNTLADKPDFVAICKKINGGLNGYVHRLEYYERAKTIMGLT